MKTSTCFLLLTICMGAALPGSLWVGMWLAAKFSTIYLFPVPVLLCTVGLVLFILRAEDALLAE